MVDTVISTKDLYKTYHMGEVEVQALRDATFEIHRGELVSITGPSGSGKSTLMNIIGCLDSPSGGEYYLDGTLVSNMRDDELAKIRNQKIGFIFQSFNLLPRITALQNVELPMRYAGMKSGRAAKAREVLEKVGLGDRVNHRPTELSGGQQQRVAIARALINDPAILLADEPTGNLDLKSGKDIMKMILTLNQELGMTIIIVTHDPNVAAQTQRVIRISDGVVEPENSMNIGQQFIEALDSMRSNKLRTVLTMLGVIIGVAAVVSMMAIGNGAQASISSSINAIGTNLIFVSSGARGINNPKPLTLADAAALADPNQAPDVLRVAAIIQGRVTVAFSGQTTNTQTMAVTSNYGDVRNVTVSEGTFITAEQNATRAAVAVIGTQTATDLFGTTSGVIGKSIRINGQPFRVTGLLTSKGGSSFGNQDDQIIVPLSTGQTRLFTRKRNQVDQVFVEAKTSDTVTSASDEITRILQARHRIVAGKNDFSITKQADILSTASTITGTLTLFLGGIAGIALLVGGIGIMNIMLVSVTERTREIGLRKALGARRSDILVQFLVESSLISLIGGGIGILLAYGISTLVARLAASSGTALNPVIDSSSVLLATLFSAAVGLFFGIYPANRAARLEPVEALRYSE